MTKEKQPLQQHLQKSYGKKFPIFMNYFLVLIK